jgi:hypothetical protein
MPDSPSYMEQAVDAVAEGLLIGDRRTLRQQHVGLASTQDGAALLIEAALDSLTPEEEEANHG